MNKTLLLTIKDPENTFVFGDPHFDHTNIIRYCHRPFTSTEEMNKTLLDNYNDLIKTDSTVLFLGDMSFGRGAHTAQYWRERLRGDIVYFKGSHDDVIDPTTDEKACNTAIAKAGNRVLFLAHNPIDISPSWTGWAIHAHQHNKTIFVNREIKRVCVSVELTDYKPVRLSHILELINGCT